MIAEQIGFGIMATVLIFSGTRVVTSQNLIRGVLWLGLTLSSTAILFLMLEAPFLAAIQLLLYTGGVITLMLFGIMLTNRETGVLVLNRQTSRKKGAVVAALMFGVLAGALFRSEDALPLMDAEAAEVTTEALGQSFLTEHLLAFEVLSVLLLAAMIGAIVIARRRDFGAEPTGLHLQRLARMGTGDLALRTATASLETRKSLMPKPPTSARPEQPEEEE